MATPLPNPFAWQSNHNSKYLHSDGEIEGQKGILKFTEENPNYVFEPDDASGHVKIKCSENKLYLKGVWNRGSEKWLIVAAAEKADEDSTSFQHKPYNSSFRMLHVKSNLYLRPYKIGSSDAVLCAVDPRPDPENVDLFTAYGYP